MYLFRSIANQDKGLKGKELKTREYTHNTSWCK